MLHRLGFTRLSVRPKHPASDPEAQERFKKASLSWSARACPSTPAASRSRSGSKTVERGAFNRVGQQGTLTRIWAETGSRPSAPRSDGYQSVYFPRVKPEGILWQGNRMKEGFPVFATSRLVRRIRWRPNSTTMRPYPGSLTRRPNRQVV